MGGEDSPWGYTDGMKPRLTADFEARKRANVMQVLLKCARLINEKAIERVNEQAGQAMFRQSLANLLPHIALEGTRTTELARKVGISKQAVSKLVGEFVAQGVLEMLPDPTDGRARLVRFTPFGLKAIDHGLSVLAGIEQELGEQLGAEKMQALHTLLLSLLSALQPSESASAVLRK
jgi:DNA-binding MarR family transcriptional regulator